MERRKFLSGSIVAAFTSISGCLNDDDESVDGNDSDKKTATSNESTCIQKDNWESGMSTNKKRVEQDTIAGRRNCMNAQRPEPTGDICSEFQIKDEEGEQHTYYSIGVKQYPTLPDLLNIDTVLPFIYEYERAYSQNLAILEYGERLVQGSVTIKEDLTKEIDIYKNIFVVGIEYAQPLTFIKNEDLSDEDNKFSGFSYEDNFSDAAVYAVDKTGLLRTDAQPDEIRNQDIPDPVKSGDVIECFGNRS
jgi:hypothetical protein